MTARSEDDHANTPPGPGVDASGQAVLDPTKNVLDLVDAAIKRQDDLRQAENSHIREMEALRATHSSEMRQAEADRLDAIRAVDVTAVQQSRLEAETRASALAAQVVATADAFRSALAAALEPLQKDIADLRRAQYEAQGSKGQSLDARSLVFAVLGVIGVAAAVVIALVK